MRGPARDTWELLRLPLILILIGVVTTISAVTWNRLSCCAGGASIGAGMLWLLWLALLAGGGVWGIITVVTGRSKR
ncbi:hypothetical protein ACFYE2_16380 [Kocuria sp. CPCC 205300]|uniref:hypothetical protein n=1 Tax=Kocuria sabuli TaxID=3071448 RepID=UPI0036DCC7E4